MRTVHGATKCSASRKTVGNMIGSLRGVVLERSQSGTVLIEVAGVGYVCSVTPSTLAELEPTVQTYLYIHHHVREDAQTLYAFATRDERDILRHSLPLMESDHQWHWQYCPYTARARLSTSSPPLTLFRSRSFRVSAKDC